MLRIISKTGWSKDDWKDFAKSVVGIIAFLIWFYAFTIGLAIITP